MHAANRNLFSDNIRDVGDVEQSTAGQIRERREFRATGCAYHWSARGRNLQITFANTAKTPAVLNLGYMLGNGAKFWPTKFHLLVHDAAGAERLLRWKTGGIDGRVDDFLVPLMPGGKYAIAFSLDDLIGDGKDGNWSSAIQAGEKVEAVYEGTAIDPARALIPALPIWVGELKSDSIVYDAK